MNKKNSLGVLTVNLSEEGMDAFERAVRLCTIISGKLGHLLEENRLVGISGNFISKASMSETLASIERGIGKTAVVFLVTDFCSARKECTKNFFQTIKEAAFKKGNTHVFYIILDMLEEFQQMEHGFDSEKMGNELEAFQLGALPCLSSCEQMTYTSGLRRLAELMNRIICNDLPEESFPKYDWEMLSRIARHINRESFNEGEPRIGAIPKYQFGEDGAPLITEETIKQFQMNWAQWETNHPAATFVKVVYKCPHCCHELDRWSFHKEPNIIKCACCGNLVDASKTELIKN